MIIEGRAETSQGGQIYANSSAGVTTKLDRILSPFFLLFYGSDLQNLKCSTNLIDNQIGKVFIIMVE